MFKKILKSILVLTVVLATAGVATRAWFTSTVTAANNQIQTGTLLLSIDTTQSHSANNGTWSYPINYYVVYDNNGAVTPGHPFESWVNAEPGVYDDYGTGSEHVWPRPAGNYSWWVAVRNYGSLPMKVWADLSGTWTSVPRNHLLEGGNSYVIPANVHRYAVTASAGCENHEECQSLRSALMAYSYTPAVSVAAAGSANYTPTPGGYYLTNNGTSGGTPLVLNKNEFAILRVDAYLDSNAPNDYQGATYNYTFTAKASQVGDPAW